MRKRLVRLTAVCVLSSLLCGCTASVPLAQSSPAATLPPAAVAHAAPSGDAQQEYTAAVALYLPDHTGTRLLAQYETVTLSATRHGAEAVVRALLAHPENERVAALSGTADLQLASVNPVEVSRDVATVNLTSSALQLDHPTLYMVSQAITNTLTQWEDIQFVNILISGVQPGLDVGASTPAGSLQRAAGEDISASWDRALAQSAAEDGRRASYTATLYFPAAGGKGILPEAQNIAFEGGGQSAMARTLLRALSAGAQQLTGVPQLPDLDALLTQAPVVSEIAGSGGRKLTLRFHESLNELTVLQGVPRSVLMASLTYTLTTFLPGISGLEVFVGSELIESVTPTGIYEGAGQTIPFADGVQRRSDYSAFLLGYCTLYFAYEGAYLAKTQRPVPYYQTVNPRYLLGQLMLGPQPYDSRTGLTAALPEGLRDADLLGVALEDDVLLLNFTQALRALMQGMSATEERLLVYSLVNTLCALPNVRRVCFFEAGAQPETFAGSIYLPGVFLQNPGIVTDN